MEKMVPEKSLEKGGKMLRTSTFPITVFFPLKDNFYVGKQPLSWEKWGTDKTPLGQTPPRTKAPWTKPPYP